MSTNNFLFNFNKINSKNSSSELKVASVFKRGLAGIIDIHITVILMAIYLEIIFRSFYINKYYDFIVKFEETFGTKTPKNTPDHLEFIFHHEIFLWTIIVFISTIFIGAIYHAYFNSSFWQATIGKRIMKIIITNNLQQKITFGQGIFHYFLSLIPYFFIAFLVFYARKNNISIFETFNSSPKILALGIFFLAINQVNIFNKKKINFFDYIAKIEFYKSKTHFSYPWNSNSISNKND